LCGGAAAFPRSVREKQIMSISTFDISVKNLFGTEIDRLHTNIVSSHDKAKEILAQGDFVRHKHQEGNSNSSLESTVAGSLKVAQNLVGSIKPDSKQHDNVAIAENLQKTIAAMRSFWKK
jgi:hypothetical protein